jgi:CheY-like chemotaxis protein
MVREGCSRAKPARRTGAAVRAEPGWGRRCGRAYARRVSVRLVLAEDSYLAREGLRRLLETRPDLEVVGDCGDLPSLLAAVREHEPDVVVTDIRMPPDGSDEGIRAANELWETRPELGVVVLSSYAEPAYALALLEDGSEGRAYLLKERIGAQGRRIQACETPPRTPRCRQRQHII